MIKQALGTRKAQPYDIHFALLKQARLLRLLFSKKLVGLVVGAVV